MMTNSMNPEDKAAWEALSEDEKRAWEAVATPIHPGEILEEEFLKPAGLSRNALALAIGVTATRINEIVQGKRAITAETALRLGRYFSVSPEMWLGLQADYDLEVSHQKFDADLERIKPRELAHA